MKFKSIKGTKDILPADVHVWHEIEKIIMSSMEHYNYKEIRTPIFEETSLFARGIGDLTDIVAKEMYTFTDRGGDSLTLKPEMTASTIRAYIQHNLGEQQPLTKVYYISPAFRQERPQAGRLRQFHQFGAEAIGGSSAEIDAEIIILSSEIYKKFGINNFEVKINSVGCQVCRGSYKEILKTFLLKVSDELSEDSKRRLETNPMRILDSKNDSDKKLIENAPLMKDYLCQECSSHFESLQNNLKLCDLNFTVDGKIVRGLDYYTKTAYEIISKDLGSQDALLGGGRYDLLVKELGGKHTPAVGFAAGLERLIMVLEKKQNNSIQPKVLKLYIAAMDDNSRKYAFKEVFRLRSAGISCEIDFMNRSLKSQMREASRQNAEYVSVLGDNEIKSNKWILKQMKTGMQQEVALDQLPNYLSEKE